jgi:hypothetical protein
MDKDEETGKDVAFEKTIMGGTVLTNYTSAVERVSFW